MPEPKLSETEIVDRVDELSGWSLQNNALTKTFAFADFVQAMRFVNRLAEIAEAVQHHPDIDIRYDKVTLALSTHDSGGITAKDFALAEKADTAAGN